MENTCGSETLTKETSTRLLEDGKPLQKKRCEMLKGIMNKDSGKCA